MRTSGSAIVREDTTAEVRALLALDAIPGIGLVRLRKLVDRFGSAVVALRAPAAAFESIAGSGTAAARGDSQLRDRIDAGLAEADRLSIDVCTWSSAD